MMTIKEISWIFFCSNVVYHGEMAKKSEMERKRSEPNDEDEGETLYIFFSLSDQELTF